MDAKRLWYTLRLCMTRGAYGRAGYLKKHRIFKSVGKNCSYMPRKVPLYPNLIKLGDYVSVASQVAFLTHDGMHLMLGERNEILPDNLKEFKFKEGLGCIEIGNHVFIASGVTIGYNVRIGDNVLITADSVVMNDIPSNSVVRGNPAKVICSLTQFLQMKAAKAGYPDGMDHSMGRYVGRDLEAWLWNEFYRSRKRNG